MSEDLASAIRWARDQAAKWRTSPNQSSYMVENYTLLADAAEKTMPAPRWIVLSWRHLQDVRERKEFNSQQEAQHYAKLLIEDGNCKIEIERLS